MDYRVFISFNDGAWSEKWKVSFLHKWGYLISASSMNSYHYSMTLISLSDNWISSYFTSFKLMKTPKKEFALFTHIMAIYNKYEHIISYFYGWLLYKCFNILISSFITEKHLILRSINFLDNISTTCTYFTIWIRFIISNLWPLFSILSSILICNDDFVGLFKAKFTKLSITSSFGRSMFYNKTE